MTATFFPVARSSPYEAFRGAPALGLPPANPVRLVNPVLGSGPVSPSRASRLPVYPAVPIDTSAQGLRFSNPGFANPGYANAEFANPGFTNTGFNPGPADPYTRAVKGSVRIPFKGFTGEDSIGSIFADYPTSPFYGSSSGRFRSNG